MLIVSYQVSSIRATVSEIRFSPMEFLMWDCLTIVALGWGQIQTENLNYINIKRFSRKRWMLELCDVMLQFYPKEIKKILSRIERFKEPRRLWELRPND